MEKAINLSVAVIENETDGVIFLHKITKGAADKSYGIEVAKLAGIPKPVLSRARTILHELESKKRKQENALQMNLFSGENPKEKIIEVEIQKESEIEKKLRDIDINRLTPIQALTTLEELKNEIK